jgi:hypothetical protein
MMRKTLTPRIDYLEAIPTYERNLLDALMKQVRFDVFEYIVAVDLLFRCLKFLVTGHIWPPNQTYPA